MIVERWQMEQIIRHKWAIVAWLVVNLADSLLTFVLLGMGGDEVWLILPVVHSMYWTTVVKWSGVALIGGMLAWINRLRWLRWFTVGMVLVVLWNLTGLVPAGLKPPGAIAILE